MVDETTANDYGRLARVEVRVTLAEKKQLGELSKEAGLTISDWIRTKTLGVKPLLRKPSPDKEILLRFLASFGKAASNLNQITRQLNRKQDNEEFEIPLSNINDLLSDMKNIADKLRSVLGNDRKR